MPRRILELLQNPHERIIAGLMWALSTLTGGWLFGGEPGNWIASGVTSLFGILAMYSFKAYSDARRERRLEKEKANEIESGERKGVYANYERVIELLNKQHEQTLEQVNKTHAKILHDQRESFAAIITQKETFWSARCDEIRNEKHDETRRLAAACQRLDLARERAREKGYELDFLFPPVPSENP